MKQERKETGREGWEVGEQKKKRGRVLGVILSCYGHGSGSLTQAPSAGCVCHPGKPFTPWSPLKDIGHATVRSVVTHVLIHS